MHSEASRQTLYNCKRCRKSGDVDKRNCFWYGDEVQKIKAFQDVADKDEILLKQNEVNEITSDELIAFISDVMFMYPQLSPLEVCFNIFKAVCPKSLIEGGLDEMLSMEAFCREYHVPPLGAEIGYLDYPNILVQSFGVIGVTRDRVRAKEMKQLEANHGQRSKT